MPSEEELRTLLARTAEAAELDFKSKFEVADASDWLEIIKDIAAFANSGGGTILIGINDDGTPSGADVAGALAIDPADLTNRTYKYTSTHFHGFEFIECEQGGHKIRAIMIRSCRVPLVFTRVGTYKVAHGRQKTVFSVPAGPSGALPLRLTDDPTAPAYYAVPIDTSHPFRQKEVVREVNAKLAGRKVINAHYILCIRRVYSVQKGIKFCYTQNYATPRYSQAFVDWVLQKYEEDESFFNKTKQQFDQLKQGAI
jgi:Putative DNA-binding domain/EC042_2821-lke REase